MRKTIEKNIAFDDKSKHFYVTMNYGNDGTGKRVKKVKTFPTKQEARKALKEFEANKTIGTLMFPTGVTLKQWSEYWLNDVKSINCEETTLYGYRNIINNHIIPYLGNYKLQELNISLINKYFKDKLGQGLSRNTLRKHYDLLKYILKQAVFEDKIQKNPMDKIEPIKMQKYKPAFYNLYQLRDLFEAVENDRIEIAVKLAGMLGLRREEIVGLKWDCVDFDRSRIKISHARTQAGSRIIEKSTKNDSSCRILYLPDELAGLLQKKKNEQKVMKSEMKNGYQDAGFVLTWDDGKPYRPNYLSELFRNFIEKNDLPEITLHGLRHTFSSIANDLEVSLYDISKALGHGSVGITEQIYTHMFGDVHIKAISKIIEVLKE